MTAAPSVPSIRRRLSRALLGWSLVWSVAVASAVWLAAWHEVEELLDDSLQASAALLATLLREPADEPGRAPVPLPAAARSPDHDERFAWQWVDPAGQVLRHSTHAPATAWRATPSAGFGRTREWRLYGLPLGPDGGMLYTAQTVAERSEAHAAVAISAVLATLAIGLLGQVWLRSRLRHELQPLQRLSERLAAHEPRDDAATLGPAERQELLPVHAAIDDLARRLAQRVDNERAFAGNAAHALRTPLAGIDAQLAVALREAPPALQPRLQRVRDAATRLQRVVAALLGLFRSAAAPRRQPIDLPALVARLPLERLAVEVDPQARLEADPDLLTAALVNLLDNAERHGATRARLTTPAASVLRLDDDGPGVPPERRALLRRALDAQRYDDTVGLGLMLADRVARSHGGQLRLPDVARGFAVELHLAASAPD